MLDNAILKDFASENGSTRCKREAVAHLCGTHGVGQRQACAVLAFGRSSVRDRSLRPDDAICVI